ncbi:MAG: metal ABC transporter ATP-binding protein [Clostridia bacterium]|nr:metal ABC transporter ATP-binding protein [Clostridia bacterium]MBQ6092055.1 metal ABC transporter ATP-binding protein [Clostridia bacterium]
MELLRLTDVSVGYEGKPVASHLSLTLSQGDYLCIVGENGAGKSTLMKTLLGLRTPLSGTIAFSDAIAHNEIGYLPQQTQVQRDFPATVWEVVLSGCLNRSGLRPFYSKAQRQAALQWLERLDIAHLKNRSYRALSGGQQQRVLLARALCATKKLLVLDEPVAGLDPIVTADLYALIQRINREEGATIIMVSHDIAAALQYATHILQVGGSDSFFGTVEEYRQSELGRLFLGKAGEGHA